MSGTLREQLRIGRTDKGAIRPPEIVQLLRTKKMPKQVEITDVLDGAHMIQQLTGGVPALPGESLPSFLLRLFLGLVVRSVVSEESSIRLFRGAALHMGGLPHTPRIPTNQVIAGNDIDRQTLDGGARRYTGPTGVEEQRPLRRIR